MTDHQIIKPTTPLENEQTVNTDKQSLGIKEKMNKDNASEESNTITPTDINTHDQLTRALHNLDLLNAQLGVAGSLLVGQYHLQKQRESQPVQPVAYPQYGSQMPAQPYISAPQPVAPVSVQAPPPPVSAYQNPQQINPVSVGQTTKYQQPVPQTPVQNQIQTTPPSIPSSS